MPAQEEMDATQTAEQEDEEAVGPGSGDEDEKSLFSDDYEDSDEEQDLVQVEDPGLAGMLNFALVEELSPDISKAVTLADCLEGFGKHWQGQITGGLGKSQTGQERARETKHIDDFISHDWSTSGTAKFVTLCTLYNGRPSIAVAVLVSLSVGILETVFEQLRVLPGFFVIIGRERMEVQNAGCFGLLCGMCAYVLALCFWQRVQHVVCCKSRQVFMDRLCIEQNDPEKKKKGIMGLAGFLKLSKRLVVLWSPRYFTRLWCVYEIATWTKLRKSLRQIIIAPVAQGVFMLLVLCGVFVVMVLLTGLAQMESWELYALLLGLVTAAIMMAPLYAVRNLVCDLRVMKVQIEGFSFMSAQCYCCGVDHLIPGTSTRIPCDRQIIGNKLEEWFGPQSSGIIRQGMAKELYLALAKSGTRGTTGESAQELFDRYVQEVFGHYILKKVGGSRVSYSVAVATTLPAFFYICDRLHMLSTLEPLELWRMSTHYSVVVFGFFPSLVRLALDLTLLADYLFQGRKSVPGNLPAAMLLAMSVLAGITFFWLFLLDYTLFHEQVVFQILVNSCTLLVTAALYYNDLIDCCASLRRSRKRPTAARPPLQRLKTMKARRSLRPSHRDSGPLQKGKSWQPVPVPEEPESPSPPNQRQVTFGKTMPDFSIVLPGALEPETLD